MNPNKPVYRPETKVSDMLKDGWMRDFCPRQTQAEMESMGIHMSIELINAYWLELDASYARDCEINSTRR